MQLLRWWKNRLTYLCLNGDKSLFVDQIWLNLAPIFFPGGKILRTPGVNLGHWNLHDGALEKRDAGEYFFDGSPLLFFHFSGWDIEKPERLSRHTPTLHSGTVKYWDEISRLYKEELLLNGFEQCWKQPYSFDHFFDGRMITVEDRRKYLRSVQANTDGGINPFDHPEVFPAPRRYFRKFLKMVEKIYE